MRRRPLAPILAFTLFASAAIPAQRSIWIVDAAQGPGSHFADIPPAIAAAAHGDVIEVRAGDYSGFQIVNKALSILGAPGARLVKFQAGTLLVAADIAIANLEPNRAVAIRALQVGRIDVQRCAGRVTLQDLGQVATGRSTEIEDCAQVTLSGCSLTGQAAITRSKAILADCTVTGQSAPVWFPEFRPKAALVIDGADAIASRCTLTGETWTSVFPDGAPAIDVISGRLTLTGDGSGVVAAGTSPSAGMPAVTGQGELLLDPTVSLVPTGGAPALVAALTAKGVDTPSLTARDGRLGATATVDIFFRPAQVYALLLSVPSPPFSISLLTGELWVDPLVATVVTSGALDETGRASVQFLLPDVPRLIGARVTWQAAAGNLAGLRLSNPVDWVLRN